jgi:hypothetical protein
MVNLECGPGERKGDAACSGIASCANRGAGHARDCRLTQVLDRPESSENNATARNPPQGGNNKRGRGFAAEARVGRQAR